MLASTRVWRFVPLVIALANTTTVFAQSALVWESDIERARQAAAQTNRLVLIHLGAPWCKPCMDLESRVFAQPGFGSALNNNFVAVKLNIDENASLATYYGVSQIPTDLVITPQGQLVYKTASPANADLYVTTMLGIVQGGAAPTQVAQVAPPVATNAGPTQAIATPPSNYQVSQPAPPVSTVPTQSSPPTPDNRYADYFNNRASAPTQPSVAAPPSVPQQSNISTTPAAQYAAVVGAGAPPVAVPAMNPAQPSAPQVNATAAAPAATQPYTPSQSAAPPSQPVVQPQVAAAPQLPPGNPPLGLDGYCPVTLCESKPAAWKRGDLRWGAIHRGRTYLFAGPEQQKLFLSNPDRYSPVMAGLDPVVAVDHNVEVAGKREFGVFLDGKIYLFSSADSLDRFTRDQARYLSAASRFTGEILQAKAPGQGSQL